MIYLRISIENKDFILKPDETELLQTQRNTVPAATQLELITPTLKMTLAHS